MTRSIRAFLLVNLLLSVTLITSLAIVCNLLLEHKQLQTHLDGKLIQTAFAIQAFVCHPFQSQQLDTIQAKVDQAPLLQDNYLKKHNYAMSGVGFERVQFQVLDRKDKLLLHTNEMPKLHSLHHLSGLSDQWVNGTLWRIFAISENSMDLKVIAAEKYDFRHLLEGKITQNSIYVMLLAYPFLALLIWVIIGRGLGSVKEVTSELSQRASNRLEPMDTTHVPLEIKPLVEELNKLFTRLKEAFEREKRFAADAAHELRTPLAALKAHTQVALKASTEEERRTSLEKILAGVDRSTHVVQQLLSLSRMLPESVLERFMSIDLHKQAQEVIADLAPEAIKKHTEIELLAADNPVLINGNATAINMLIRNLVDNSIRYTPNNSLVQVVITPTPNAIKLLVIDNGPGIPENLRNRVFERFFRVLGTHSTGSGLGLGIVQQIITWHKARIVLETPESGIGLQVCVTFPVPEAFNPHDNSLHVD